MGRTAGSPPSVRLVPLLPGPRWSTGRLVGIWARREKNVGRYPSTPPPPPQLLLPRTHTSVARGEGAAL